jgi:hypothetical protein
LRTGEKEITHPEFIQHTHNFHRVETSLFFRIIMTKREPGRGTEIGERYTELQQSQSVTRFDFENCKFFPGIGGGEML